MECQECCRQGHDRDGWSPLTEKIVDKSQKLEFIFGLTGDFIQRNYLIIATI